MCLILPLASMAQVVDIPDTNLGAAVRRELGKGVNAAITREDMRLLRFFYPTRADISDLTGLEYATNLEDLDLSNNFVSDLSPVGGLTKLRLIGLRNNRVSDLSPLEYATNLEDLDLSDNFVSDLSPVGGLTKLRWIRLSNNRVSDLSPVVGLTSLFDLNLQDNFITDISPLSSLFRLYGLDLRNNFISDLTPLMENHGIGAGNWIAVSGNLLNDESINILIPALRERGIRVDNATIIFSLNSISGYPTFVGVGETFTIDLIVEDVYALAGWEIRYFRFNPSVVSVTSVEPSNFLQKEGKEVYNVEGAIDNNAGEVSGFSSVRIDTEGVNGTGILFSITFEAKAAGYGNFWFIDLSLVNVNRRDTRWQPRIDQLRVQNYDVNGDGNVTVADLALVAENLGQTNPSVDVDGNGRVNISDLVALAQYMGKSTTSRAPSVGDVPDLNPMMVQKWIDMAREVDDGSLTFYEGIATLERLLASLVPEETILMANYPNPFNPETWIPYHLASAADVTLIIYDVKGGLVRQLELGHQMAGYYTDRSKAAYWDGRNDVGESVASSVYFYTLTAGDFSATRKMVILK